MPATRSTPLRTVARETTQLERYEKKAELLRRLAGRAAWLAEGQDDALDKRLTQLAGALKQARNADLELVLKALDGDVRQLEDRRRNTRTVISRELGLLVRQVTALAHTRELKGAMKRFERSVVGRLENPDRFGPLLAELARLQAEVHAQLDAPRPSFWQRLFGRGPDVPALPLAAIGGQLDGLLAAIGEEEPGTQVQDRLTQDNLAEVLGEVVARVTDVATAERKEYEQFLQLMNERLRIAHDALGDCSGLHEEGAAASVRLGETVRERVGAMQLSMAKAHTLDDLKAEVSGNLDQIVGALDHFQRDNPVQKLSERLHEFEREVEAMQQHVAAAESELEAERERALRDVLTRLPNREAYEQRLADEMARWTRYERPFTLAVIDIDLFKRVNDDHGHAVGDKVLMVVAELVSDRLRQNDFVSRYGGEEFVVLLPETEQEEGLAVMDAVREAIETHELALGDTSLHVTISIGIAGARGDDTGESLFERADSALYGAKAAGRNCCQVADWE